MVPQMVSRSRRILLFEARRNLARKIARERMERHAAAAIETKRMEVVSLAATKLQSTFRGQMHRNAYASTLRAQQLARADEAECASPVALAAPVVVHKRGPANVDVEHFTVTPEGHVAYVLRVGLTTTTSTFNFPSSTAAAAAATATATTATTTAAGVMRTRYSEVSALHSLLLTEYDSKNSKKLPSMPPKTWCRSTDVLFLERRKNQLQIYLNCLLQNPEIVRTSAMRKFFQSLVQING
jgi:hypothetical protein